MRPRTAILLAFGWTLLCGAWYFAPADVRISGDDVRPVVAERASPAAPISGGGIATFTTTSPTLTIPTLGTLTNSISRAGSAINGIVPPFDMPVGQIWVDTSVLPAQRKVFDGQQWRLM